MTVTKLDLSAFGDDDPVPGYAPPAGELRKLPFADQLTEVGNGTTGSARFIEDQQRAVDRSAPKQDPRLRVGSPADQHKAAVTAAIRELGFVVPEAGALNRLAGSIPFGANVHAAVYDLGLPKAPVRSRSAESVVARRR